ncbi:GNAT family N-acetyltransferase [Salinibacterium sp. ZJ450]|uniref:GNAT family N-acetyltransferase n=1 Tax=Salinibacterium sp. ZJ450 TaxID=2708338 RepID=UPI001423FB6C|nr:GNAT family N-acetyltransferase [Salinibacterium sp. ZJ450]
MHRLATLRDLAAVHDVERAAGQRFRTVGMYEVADDDPISTTDFEGYLLHDDAWVTVVDGSVVAYLLVEPIDDALHVEQVTVHPLHARQGFGSRLLDLAGQHAADRSLRGLTLTTFRDVPWNAPYYARLGFAEIAREQWGPDLHRKVEQEATLGLSRWPRVVMGRPV